jgi:hypothetical protein
MGGTVGGALALLVIVLVIGGIIIGALVWDKVVDGQIDTIRDDLRTCSDNLAKTQAKHSDCVGERNHLAADNQRLSDENETLRARLGEAKANLDKARQALAGDYLVNGTIALGLVILGVAIGLAIPFALYIGGVITVAELGEPNGDD